MSDTNLTFYNTDDGKALCDFYSEAVPAVATIATSAV